MVCDDNARLLHGYLDGELDLVRSLEIEEHLKTCPDCAQELWNQQTLRKAFRSSSLYDRAPAGLADRIRASIGSETAAMPMRLGMHLRLHLACIWTCICGEYSCGEEGAGRFDGFEVADFEAGCVGMARCGCCDIDGVCDELADWAGSDEER